VFATLDPAKEVHMATVKQEQRRDGLTSNASELTGEAEHAHEPADFELDDRLRGLRLDQWFAMAEEGMPLWVC
jgi:hypothetical protein